MEKGFQEEEATCAQPGGERENKAVQGSTSNPKCGLCAERGGWRDQGVRVHLMSNGEAREGSGEQMGLEREVPGVRECITGCSRDLGKRC